MVAEPQPEVGEPRRAEGAPGGRPSPAAVQRAAAGDEGAARPLRWGRGTPARPGGRFVGVAVPTGTAGAPTVGKSRSRALGAMRTRRRVAWVRGCLSWVPGWAFWAEGWGRR